MRLAYIKWRDAVAEEATGGGRAQAQLADLEEVGILLDENEDAVLIGMEMHEDGQVEPGRWRLSIPRLLIQEMYVQEMKKAFPKKTRVV